MMAVRSSLLLVLVCSFCANAQALERRYLASMDVSKRTFTENNATTCRIEHQIPRFGSAVFTQEAGRGLRLELFSAHKFGKGIKVELRSETSSWNARETRVVLASFETSGRKRPSMIPAVVP